MIFSPVGPASRRSSSVNILPLAELCPQRLTCPRRFGFGFAVRIFLVAGRAYSQPSFYGYQGLADEHVQLLPGGFFVLELGGMDLSDNGNDPISDNQMGQTRVIQDPLLLHIGQNGRLRYIKHQPRLGIAFIDILATWPAAA
jgi:hypothetical protein